MKLHAPGSTSRIAHAFGRRAAYYDEHAHLQRVAATRLAEVFASLLPELPDGPVLEVGCGTGFLSREIVRASPDRPIEITDLSEEMVAFSKERIRGGRGRDERVLLSDRRGSSRIERPRLRFRVLDAESPNAPIDGGYAAILAGLAAQWFREPGPGLVRLGAALAPGGALAASVPVSGSFGEWRAAAETAGVRFHAADLPDAPSLLSALAVAGFKVESFQEEHRESHPSALEFFRHLKRIGAASRVEGEPLPTGAFRALLEAWGEGPVSATYRVLFLVARRRNG